MLESETLAAEEVAAEMTDMAKDDESKVTEARQSQRIAAQLRDKLNSLRSSLTRVTAVSESSPEVSPTDAEEAILKAASEKKRMSLSKKAKQVKSSVDSLLTRIEKEMEAVSWYPFWMSFCLNDWFC